MLEIRNRSFDGAKAIWVPNAETGYIKAEVVGEGDKAGTTKVSLTLRNTLMQTLTVGSSCWRQRKERPQR